MKIWCKKTVDHKLAPADEYAYEKISKLKLNAEIEVDIRQPRNAKFHRKFMSLLRLVFENQEIYEDFEAFRKEVTMRCGFWQEHHHLSGKISYEAKSISFGKMDEVEFGELYDRAIDILIDNFIPGTDRNELEQAVLEYVG